MLRPHHGAWRLHRPELYILERKKKKRILQPPMHHPPPPPTQVLVHICKLRGKYVPAGSEVQKYVEKFKNVVFKMACSFYISQCVWWS
jgi:hypothetical protein